MKKRKSLYHGHRFPAAIISLAVRWYFRFQLGLRDIEELLFERGVVVSYETIRRWCDKFGAGFAHRVKAARRKPGRTWHLDEVFVTLRGEPYLLWRAVATSTAPNSTSCCRNIATRPQQSVSSTACWPPVPTRHEGLSPISCAAIRRRKPRLPNWRTSSTSS
ncbi:hypothetical protein QF000_007996 [Paraburkholderia atlantica]